MEALGGEVAICTPVSVSADTGDFSSLEICQWDSLDTGEGRTYLNNNVLVFRFL